VSKRNVRRRNY